ncbi:microtubule-associated proteins 1A/1B light chain 3C-like [Thrips palmi]|uniref:Microtubule-associated proteins 1A/1B light chain 3C-like n=1 Tax=Thrips palmi TaxID=161013 RepID=A0A6P8ZU19_THRPL|nr:microtubule-associated proteins 1A/1B light chain 3C-like [Thrips palmi]
MLKMEMSSKLDKNSNLKKITKRKKAYASRIEEVAAMRTKFPTKVPTIVKRFHKETSLPLLEKVKFLVPEETTMSQFVAIIRKRMNLRPNQAIYLLVNNRSMMNLSMTIAEVYNEHKDDDGMLHVTYASQEVFGAPDVSDMRVSTNNYNRGDRVDP